MISSNAASRLSCRRRERTAEVAIPGRRATGISFQPKELAALSKPLLDGAIAGVPRRRLRSLGAPIRTRVPGRCALGALSGPGRPGLAAFRFMIAGATSTVQVGKISRAREAAAAELDKLDNAL